MFEGLVEAVEDGSEEHFGELLQVDYSFLFFDWVLPLGIEIDELIGVLPVLVEDLDAHDVL